MLHLFWKIYFITWFESLKVYPPLICSRVHIHSCFLPCTNVLTLFGLGVMSLLRPLLLDAVPTIQQTAALALGRLANYNDDLAEAVVKGDILPQLVYSLAEQNVSFFSWTSLIWMKRFVLRYRTVMLKFAFAQYKNFYFWLLTLSAKQSRLI